MRYVLLISACLLTACATAPSGSTKNTKNTLNMPKLDAGECALFGWTADERRKFVFYADEDEAKFAPEDQVVKLAANAAFPALDYTDPSGDAVTLNLGGSEPLVGGTRYPTARITSKTADGWDRVMPVAIVRSCQSG